MIRLLHFLLLPLLRRRAFRQCVDTDDWLINDGWIRAGAWRYRCTIPAIPAGTWACGCKTNLVGAHGTLCKHPLPANMRTGMDP